MVVIRRSPFWFQVGWFTTTHLSDNYHQKAWGLTIQIKRLIDLTIKLFEIYNISLLQLH